MLSILIALCLVLAPAAFADLGGGAFRDVVVQECPLDASETDVACGTGKKNRGKCTVAFLTSETLAALGDKRPGNCESSTKKLVKSGLPATLLERLNPSGAAGKYCGVCNVHGSSRPDVRIENPEVSCCLEEIEAMAVVRAYLNQLRHCYEQALQRRPDYEGNVDVRFHVAADGKTAEPSVKPAAEDQPLVECFSSKIGRWTFPKPKRKKSDGDVVVAFRLNLGRRPAIALPEAPKD